MGRYGGAFCYVPRKFYYYLSDGFTDERQINRLMCSIVKFYGGGTSFEWLEEQPFDKLSMLYDEMAWQIREQNKANKRS